VVKTRSAPKDTEVKTRIKKMLALAMPCLVIITGIEKILKVNSGSPGLNILDKAGIAIQREKSGIKNQVRFKKKTRPMEEKKASNKQKK
jgi:hypothetical protein